LVQQFCSDGSKSNARARLRGLNVNSYPFSVCFRDRRSRPRSSRGNIVAGVDDAGIQTGESKKQPIDMMGTKLI